MRFFLYDQVDKTLDALFQEWGLVDAVLEELEHLDLTDEFRTRARQRARTRKNPSASELNHRAWQAVDPDGSKKGDPARALRLARAAVKLAPESPYYLAVLAWALFATGLEDEALAASARALELAPASEKEAFQGHLDRLRSMIEGK